MRNTVPADVIIVIIIETFKKRLADYFQLLSYQ